MTDDKGKTPLQASGEGRPKVRDDGVGSPTAHGRTQSESQGGAYPNPHKGTEGKKPIDGIMGHGGQSEIDYHGTGQLGETDIEGQENANSPAKHD